MEIKLTETELSFVLEVVKSKSDHEGISEEQAAKDLLAIGISAWLEMQSMNRRLEKLKRD